MITICVGDIHGCFDKLSDLLEECRRYLKGRSAHYVFLGDYIDRGTNSCATVETLMALQAEAPNTVTCLKGNHEELLLWAVSESDLEEHWLSNGGVQTLNSYARRRAVDLPKEHIDWIKGLPTFYDDGLRFFVHAGVSPDYPLSEQKDYDLLWIRRRFLETDKQFPRYIVHGHTPQVNGKPDIRANRLNLDTGAVFGGPLTAGIFKDDEATAFDFIASQF